MTREKNCVLVETPFQKSWLHLGMVRVLHCYYYMTPPMHFQWQLQVLHFAVYTAPLPSIHPWWSIIHFFLHSFIPLLFERKANSPSPPAITSQSCTSPTTFRTSLSHDPETCSTRWLLRWRKMEVSTNSLHHCPLHSGSFGRAASSWGHCRSEVEKTEKWTISQKK